MFGNRVPFHSPNGTVCAHLPSLRVRSGPPTQSVLLVLNTSGFLVVDFEPNRFGVTQFPSICARVLLVSTSLDVIFKHFIASVIFGHIRVVWFDELQVTQPIAHLFILTAHQYWDSCCCLTLFASLQNQNKSLLIWSPYVWSAQSHSTIRRKCSHHSFFHSEHRFWGTRVNRQTMSSLIIVSNGQFTQTWKAHHASTVTPKIRKKKQNTCPERSLHCSINNRPHRPGVRDTIRTLTSLPHLGHRFSDFLSLFLLLFLPAGRCRVPVHRRHLLRTTSSWA